MSKLKPLFEKQMLDRMNDAPNVLEALDILAEYYDLENCTPGKIVRTAFISKMIGGMASLGAKPKQKYQ